MAAPGPEARLAALGLALPVLSEPRGNYVRARRHGDLLHLAGHGPVADHTGTRPVGKVGREFDLEAGQAFARSAGLALLRTIHDELGDLSHVAAVLRVFGMVNVANGFSATPRVIDGCSDLFVEVFGPAVGRHARSAIGVAELPFGMPVEIEAVVVVTDAPEGHAD